MALTARRGKVRKMPRLAATRARRPVGPRWRAISPERRGQSSERLAVSLVLHIQTGAVVNRRPVGSCAVLRVYEVLRFPARLWLIAVVRPRRLSRAILSRPEHCTGAENLARTISIAGPVRCSVRSNRVVSTTLTRSGAVALERV